MNVLLDHEIEEFFMKFFPKKVNSWVSFPPRSIRFKKLPVFTHYIMIFLALASVTSEFVSKYMGNNIDDRDDLIIERSLVLFGFRRLLKRFTSEELNNSLWFNQPQ